MSLTGSPKAPRSWPGTPAVRRMRVTGGTIVGLIPAGRSQPEIFRGRHTSKLRALLRSLHVARQTRREFLALGMSALRLAPVGRKDMFRSIPKITARLQQWYRLKISESITAQRVFSIGLLLECKHASPVPVHVEYSPAFGCGFVQPSIELSYRRLTIVGPLLFGISMVQIRQKCELRRHLYTATSGGRHPSYQKPRSAGGQCAPEHRRLCRCRR